MSSVDSQEQDLAQSLVGESSLVLPGEDPLLHNEGNAAASVHPHPAAIVSTVSSRPKPKAGRRSKAINYLERSLCSDSILHTDLHSLPTIT